jgi:hypothetical protein
MSDARHDLRETIEVALVELRAIAQPYEIAKLRELALDAEDAATVEEIAEIAREVERLRAFCVSRAASAENRIGVARRA